MNAANYTINVQTHHVHVLIPKTFPDYRNEVQNKQSRRNGIFIEKQWATLLCNTEGFEGIQIMYKSRRDAMFIENKMQPFSSVRPLRGRMYTGSYHL